MPTRAVARLFKCNCCKASFAKPMDPAWGFLKGLACWFGASLVLVAFLIFSSAKRADVSWGGADSFMFIGLFLLFFGLIVVGAAYVFSSVLSSPRCPECRSTNFAKPE